MIRSVFRPSRTENGKRVRQRLYVGQYRLDGETGITRIPLGTSDKQTAEARLRSIVEDKERERMGLLPPKEEREAASLDLAEHLNAFIAEKRETSTCPRYVRELELRLNRTIREIGWKQARDISASSFIAWRQKQSLSAKFLNEFLISAKAFATWLRVHRKALAADPLESVSPLSLVGKETFVRRALTNEEINRLLSVSGRRSVIYTLAIYTGLRRNELKQLEWSDVSLDSEQPTLVARETTTKNRKMARIPLHKEAARALREFREDSAASGQIFLGIFPKIATFRKDLEAAGIEKFDARGRKVDFHSLRKTFGTLLGLSGATLQLRMEAMRHSDPKLTMKTYTDSELLPLRETIAMLPALGPYAQIHAQTSVETGSNESRTVATVEEFISPESLINTASRGHLSRTVADGLKKGNGARYRVRTCDPYRVKVVLYH